MAHDAAAASPPARGDGFYCSTSGSYFADMESLAEHYKSDFHRYNLKRKVAGLPPVTKEWFEARKAQLTSASAAPHQRVWLDPLTKKRFGSQNTYQAHVNSKKYQEMVKASGQPAPAPVVMLRSSEAEPQANGTAAAAAKPQGFTVKAPNRLVPAGAPVAAGSEGGSDDGEDGSGWETASDELDEAAAVGMTGVRSRRQQQAAAADGSDEGEAPPEDEWQEWDVCVSLFDNKRSASMQDNLAYMYRHYGFYLPDAEALVDPEGLLKYLGAKLQYGKVPLYSAGDDASAKQFRSLHAVQRHMVDTNQCRMLFDGNEEEYEDFYDYLQADTAAENADAAANGGGDDAAGVGPSSQQLALATSGLSLGGSSSSAAQGGWELALADGGSVGAGGAKMLGSRELARYYRQRPKPADARKSVAVNTVVAQYRSLGIDTQGPAAALPDGLKRAQRERQRQQRQWLNLAMRTNVNNNLPNNVPY